VASAGVVRRRRARIDGGPPPRVRMRTSRKDPKGTRKGTSSYVARSIFREEKTPVQWPYSISAVISIGDGGSKNACSGAQGRYCLITRPRDHDRRPLSIQRPHPEPPEPEGAEGRRSLARALRAPPLPYRTEDNGKARARPAEKSSPRSPDRARSCAACAPRSLTSRQAPLRVREASDPEPGLRPTTDDQSRSPRTSTNATTSTSTARARARARAAGIYALHAPRARAFLAHSSRIPRALKARDAPERALATET
jgi:hypothetical protein